MKKWFKILHMETEALMIAEDGKINEVEEDRIVAMVAPEFAKLYDDNDMMVRLLVKIAHKTIELNSEKDNLDPKDIPVRDIGTNY